MSTTLQETRRKHADKYAEFVRTACVALMAEQGEECGYYRDVYREESGEETHSAFLVTERGRLGEILAKVDNTLVKSRDQAIATAACDLADELLREWFSRVQ